MGKMLLPLGVVIVLAISIVFGWNYLRDSDQGGRHATLDSMESEGIPNFVLPTLQGEAVSFDDIEGELFLINFWASWCAPCVEEFPSMIQLMDKLGGRAKLVAISADHSREDMEAFLRAFDADQHDNLIVLWDKDRSVANQFGTDRLPETYIVGSDGKLIRKVAGTLDWMTPSVSTYIATLLDPDKGSEIDEDELAPSVDY